MAGLERIANEAWDRFFDFVTPDVVQMSAAEVDAELKRAGIDISVAATQVQQALEARRAREDLARARLLRPSITEKLARQLVAPIEDARRILHEMIQNRAPESVRAVLFRKLEKVATDEDIESLLQDIQRLEDLDLGGDDGER